MYVLFLNLVQQYKTWRLGTCVQCKCPTPPSSLSSCTTTVLLYWPYWLKSQMGWPVQYCRDDSSGVYFSLLCFPPLFHVMLRGAIHRLGAPAARSMRPASWLAPGHATCTEVIGPAASTEAGTPPLWTSSGGLPRGVRQLSGGAKLGRARRGLYEGRTVMSGNNVSHSKRRTRRKWKPNVQTKRLRSDILDEDVRIRITTGALRTVKKYGGLDNYILNMPEKKFGDSDFALQLKRRMNAAIRESTAESAGITEAK